MYPKETGIYLTLLTGLGMLMMMVVFFLISIIRQSKRRDREVKGQRLRDHNLIEEERKRTAADMHDDLGSSLANVKMKLLHLLDEQSGNTLILKLIENVERSSTKIRQIAHNLMPGILIAKGLCAAIHELVEEIRFSSNIKVEFINHCFDKDFTPAKSIIVFRVIQEIVANVIKHAEASHLYISIDVSAINLTIDIIDNGKGFDLKNLDPAGKQYGLINIRSRLDLLNATYSLVSTPGEGTRHLMEIGILIMKTNDESGFTY